MRWRAFWQKITGVKESEPTSAVTPLKAAEPTTPQPKVVPPPEAPAKVILARPRPSAHVPSSPLALRGSGKTQSDWLLLQIGKTGRAFISAAEKNKLTIPAPPAASGGFVRHDMTAALLGYRLVLAAYHFHQDVPSLEALRTVRTAMVGMLHRAVDITVEQAGNKELRKPLLQQAEDQFKFAEAEAIEVSSRLHEKTVQPFAPFYSSLIPAFGGPDSPEVLHQRFGAILQELYEKIEAGMAARNHQITG